MNNEEKILAILEQMQGDIASLKQGQATLEQGQEELRVGMNAMREEMNDRFDSLESSLKMAWEDISSGEKRLTQHEKEFHKVGLSHCRSVNITGRLF